MSNSTLYNDFLGNFAHKSTSPFVRDSEKMILYFLNLEKKTPSTHTWTYITSEIFQKKLNSLGEEATVYDVNEMYWSDMIENIKAYNYMVTWRASELIRSAILSLNQDEIGPPAILARSLIELSSVLLIESNNIYSIIKDISQHISIHKLAVVASQDIEDIVVRLIHGTRYKKFNGYPQATNVLTYIDKVSKDPNSKWLRELFDFLCEIAHPNIIGNARYWSKIESTNIDGSSIVRIDKNSMHKGIETILEKVLMSIGWASAVIRNGIELNQKSIQIIENLFTN